MKIPSFAAVLIVAIGADVYAFETVAKVVSVTPSREIINDPYESCQADYAHAAPNTAPQQVCHQVDHYDVKVVYYVVYEYQGQRFNTKLHYDPGPQLKIDVSVTPQ